MLTRWGIRLGSSLAGIAAGLLVASVLLSGLSVSITALVEATLIFFGVHFVVQVIALRTLVRQPSVPLAGLLALASTVVALLIVNAIVNGMKIRGIETYIGAALIVWLGMAGADVLAGRKLRELRHQDS
jgi:hypothetical protein